MLSAIRVTWRCSAGSDFVCRSHTEPKGFKAELNFASFQLSYRDEFIDVRRRQLAEALARDLQLLQGSRYSVTSVYHV